MKQQHMTKLAWVHLQRIQYLIQKTAI